MRRYLPFPDCPFFLIEHTTYQPFTQMPVNLSSTVQASAIEWVNKNLEKVFYVPIKWNSNFIRGHAFLVGMYFSLSLPVRVRARSAHIDLKLIVSKPLGSPAE